MLKHTQFLTALGHIYFWDIPKEEPRLKGKANLFHKNVNFQKANLKVSQMYVFYILLSLIYSYFFFCATRTQYVLEMYIEMALMHTNPKIVSKLQLENII